jgi:hypothetical protein
VSLHYVSETKGVSNELRKLEKIYHFENTIVSLSLLARITGKNPPKKIGERSRNVLENTRRRNIGFLALHDVDETKGVRPISPLC